MRFLSPRAMSMPSSAEAVTVTPCTLCFPSPARPTPFEQPATVPFTSFAFLPVSTTPCGRSPSRFVSPHRTVWPRRSSVPESTTITASTPSQGPTSAVRVTVSPLPTEEPQLTSASAGVATRARATRRPASLCMARFSPETDRLVNRKSRRVRRALEPRLQRLQVSLNRGPRRDQLGPEPGLDRPPPRERPQPVPELDHPPDRLLETLAGGLRVRLRAERLGRDLVPRDLGERAQELGLGLRLLESRRALYARGERVEAAVDRYEGGGGGAPAARGRERRRGRRRDPHLGRGCQDECKKCAHDAAITPRQRARN